MTIGVVRGVKAASIAAVLLLAPAALADHKRERAEPPQPTRERAEPAKGRHWVPELDPAAGGALVALLAGGALFIASRRKSK